MKPEITDATPIQSLNSLASILSETYGDVPDTETLARLLSNIVGKPMKDVEFFSPQGHILKPRKLPNILWGSSNCRARLTRENGLVATLTFPSTVGQVDEILLGLGKAELPKGETFQFSEGFTCGDLTKWGASDWYDDKEQEITQALASGKPFDTGWQGCKKEILCSRISSDGKTITCEVSVSNDFDTEGMGSRTLPATSDVDTVREALDEALDEAGENQEGNETVALYCVGKAGSDGKRANWVWTFLRDVGGWGSDTPPGDNYHRWGWQEVDEDADCSDHMAYPEDMPEDVADALAEGIMDGKAEVRAGDYIATLSN